MATASAERGHYYSGRGNKFWQLLHESGFTPFLLAPEDDASLPSYGIGMTDLVKGVAQSHDRGLDYGQANAVAGHLIAAAPQWVAFTGLTAGRAAARQLCLARPKGVALGEQPWAVPAASRLVAACEAHRGSGFGPVAVTKCCGTQPSTWWNPSSNCRPSNSSTEAWSENR